MDNQKSQTGNGSNINKDGSGNSMGKDFQKDSGNNMGSTGGNKSTGSDANKQFDSSKSSDLNKSTDLHKSSDQNKSSDQHKPAVTNNAFDSKQSMGTSSGQHNTDSNKSMGASSGQHNTDLNKMGASSGQHNTDQHKSTDFPKAGMATAPASDSAKGADLSRTADTAHKTIDKALDAAQPMADRLATTAHSSVDKMSSALTDVSARMEDKTKQLTEAYKHFADSGREYVRSSPGTSVLVALAAGYTLSKLLGRR